MSGKYNWKDLAASEWNERAEDWSENSEHMWNKGSRKNILPFFKKYLPSDAVILDIGCGSGYSTYQLNEAGYAATGMDLSEEMIHQAKGRYPDIHFQQGDVNQLPFRDGQFCGMLAINVLEWTEVPAIALTELHRVLRRGGQLCIAILGPTAGPRQFSYERLLGKEVMMNTMMPWEFAKLADEQGFELVDQLIVDKQWAQKIEQQLPQEAQQTLSFMTVFLLKKVE